jgi:hypothetical protein
LLELTRQCNVTLQESLSYTVRTRRLQILELQVLCNTGGLTSKRKPPNFVIFMQKSKGGTKVGNRNDLHDLHRQACTLQLLPSEV